MTEFTVFLNKKDYPEAKIPSKKYQSDAGFDLSSVDKVSLWPGTRKVIHTGVHINLVDGWEAQIRSRSGLAAKSGIFVLNSPGTIDSSYKGELMVILVNTSSDVFEVNVGDRIAQLVIKEVPVVTLVETDKIDTESTSRGTKGFGSTGV